MNDKFRKRIYMQMHIFFIRIRSLKYDEKRAQFKPFLIKYQCQCYIIWRFIRIETDVDANATTIDFTHIVGVICFWRYFSTFNIRGWRSANRYLINVLLYCFSLDISMTYYQMMYRNVSRNFQWLLSDITTGVCVMGRSRVLDDRSRLVILVCLCLIVTIL